MNFEALIPHLQEIIDYGILALLALMSLLSFWIFFERVFFLYSLKLQDYDNRDKLELELTNNITIISVIASNAPYVGLLGTVGGIILTFYNMGEASSIDVKTIMIGLALALKATAAGLLVAIPAIVMYSTILRKIEKKLTQFDILKDTQDETKM